jgi:photosynthetic reaction center cytochrome c subunit
MIRVATIINSILAGSLMLVLSGCEFGPKKIEQTGYRGTAGMQITAVKRISAQEVPAPPYALPADGGPLAKETYQNVKVLGNVSTERFNHLMAAINQWVAPPEAGCNYCHNPNNMASDEVYTKVVARKMLQMTININANWTPHVKQTGVTCYTCHRGNAVPKNVWARADAPDGSTRTMSNRHGQGKPVDTVAYSSLPYDPFTTYLGAKNNIRVQSAAALRGNMPGASIARTEKTYGLMMHMSSALNVNCTYCHNTDSFSSWDNSRPQRVGAWYGIRMVGEINNKYITSLTSVFPAYRKGPYGDVLKTNCTTCHQGLAKPLGGVSMIADYPALTGASMAMPAAPATEPTEATPVAAADGNTALPTAAQ